MKYHYIPQYDECTFNRIAEDTDPVLLERRKRKASANIVHQRTAILCQLSDLRDRPYRTQKDEQRMWELQDEAKRLTLEIRQLSRLTKILIRHTPGG